MGNVLGEEEHNEAFCLLKPNKDKLKGGQDDLQRERTAEDADRTSDGDSRDNVLLPSASTPYNMQTFSGRRAGCGERGSRQSIYHIAHRPAMPKKKAHHGTRLSPHLSSTTHTHHRISRCEYLPALTLPNDHAISDNRDRSMIFQLVSSPLPVSLQNTQVQMRKTSLST